MWAEDDVEDRGGVKMKMLALGCALFGSGITGAILWSGLGKEDPWYLFLLFVLYISCGLFFVLYSMKRGNK